MQTSWRRMLTRGTALLMLSGGLLGCPTTVQYQRQAGLLDTMELDQAHQRLRELLLRAANPRVDEVEVTDTFMRYHVAGTTYEVRLPFKDIWRTEVYSNNVVFIRGVGDRLLARPLLATLEDATAFADLVLALAQRAGGGQGGEHQTPVEPPPVAPGAPRA